MKLTLLIAAALLAVAPAMAQEPEGVSAAEAMDAVMWNKAAIGGPFALTDHDGKPRTEADFANTVRLVYFGFTHCPDICPTDLAAIAGALHELGAESDKVQPLFITLDPPRDAPHLKVYLEHFHPRILGLTGEAAQIRQTANAFQVYYRRIDGQGPDDYTIDHTAFTYLFDRAGNYQGFFPPGSDPKQIAAAIRPLFGQ